MTPGAFRVFLASLVMLGHLSRFAFGTAAVFVFFTLSGYWVAKMWSEKYAGGPAPYRSFIVSRLWRLLPVFLLANALTLTVLYLDGATIAIPNFSIMPNLAILGYASAAGEHYLGAAWSLDIEMQFYLLAPLLVAFLLAWPRTAIATVAVAGISSALVVVRDNHLIFGAVLPALPFFLAGIYASVFGWPRSRWLPLASAALCVSLIAACIVTPDLRYLVLRGAHALDGTDGAAMAFSLLLGACAAPLALWTVQQRSPRWDRALGDMSYSIYLLHGIVAGLIERHFSALPPLDRLAYVAGGVLIVYGASYVVWRWFDRPLQDMRPRPRSIAAPVKAAAWMRWAAPGS